MENGSPLSRTRRQHLPWKARWNMEKLAIPGNPAKSDRIRPVLVKGAHGVRVLVGVVWRMVGIRAIKVN